MLGALAAGSRVVPTGAEQPTKVGDVTHYLSLHHDGVGAREPHFTQRAAVAPVQKIKAQAGKILRSVEISNLVLNLMGEKHEIVRLIVAA